MHFNEALNFSAQSLRANPVRSMLTGLGMVIGTASVILVVTISLTSQEYILDQIEGVGSNLVYAQAEIATQLSDAQIDADFVKLDDVAAVRDQLAGRITAASAIMNTFDRMRLDGKDQYVQVIGTDEFYKPVRNMVVLSGRFLDSSDVALRQKVCLLTDKFAKRLYGSASAALGNVIKIHDLQFTVVGAFKEKVESFGQSELGAETILIPFTVLRYFAAAERVDPMDVQVKSASDVEAVTREIKHILESRHRPGAKYRVQNLAAILEAARKIATILSLVLVLVSAIALVISGIGIMNIMLVTVSERTREIGIRMAVGASRSEIQLQFLTEAVLISLTGGVLGILVGVSLPLSVQLFVDNLRIPVSPASIIIAFSVSCAVGLIFGLLPAHRASRLNPTEALRYE
ncbi:MAG TPA: ABC transporter permease [Bryobacteraceae bacterium]|nr:ABC transporter permease [Bryobacteraceae bacterium]